MEIKKITADRLEVARKIIDTIELKHGRLSADAEAYGLAQLMRSGRINIDTTTYEILASSEPTGDETYSLLVSTRQRPASNRQEEQGGKLMACPNCKSDAEPVENFAGDVVGCEDCFPTMRRWCEVGCHWVYEDDSRVRYRRPRSRYDEGALSCIDCEGD